MLPVLYKYANNTYLMIPASNVDSRTTELNKYLVLVKRQQSDAQPQIVSQIIFDNCSQKHKVPLPSRITGISRVSSLKILEVTISSQLSDSEHVSSVIGASAQTIHTLRILRSHGMCSEALQHVYRSVVTPNFYTPRVLAGDLDLFLQPIVNFYERSSDAAGLPENCRTRLATTGHLRITQNRFLSNNGNRAQPTTITARDGGLTVPSTECVVSRPGQHVLYMSTFVRVHRSSKNISAKTLIAR